MSLLYLLRDIKRVITPYASVIGVASNCFLLYMIIKKSTATMKNFKKVLLFNCILDMTFSASMLIFVPTLTVRDGTYFCITEGALGYLPHFWTLVGCDWVSIFLYSTVTNSTVVILYRYLITCHKITLPFKKLMVCMLIGWSFVFTYTTLLIIQFLIHPSGPDAHTKLVDDHFPLNETSDRYISCDVKYFAPFSLYGAAPVVTLAYVGIIVMSVAVQRKFIHLRSMLAPDQQRFHSEITTVLSLEAVTPFITVVLPIYYDMSKLVFPGMPFNWFAEFIWLPTILAPIFNVCVKLLFIRAFRNYIGGFLYSSEKKKNVGRIDTVTVF